MGEREEGTGSRPARIVRIKKSAKKDLRRLPLHIRFRFAEALDELAQGELLARPNLDVSRQQGTQNIWRLRVGDYRGLFVLDGDLIEFYRFGHRSDVYR